jgi:hypothetical protein
VVIEYNSSVGPSASLTIPYDEAFYWDGTTYFGSSLQALCTVAELRGYALVACDSRGVNAFSLAPTLPQLSVSRRNPSAYFVRRITGDISADIR